MSDKVFLLDGSHAGEVVTIPEGSGEWRLPVKQNQPGVFDSHVDVEFYHISKAVIFDRSIRIGYVDYESRQENGFMTMVTEGARSAVE